jgi:hypothetical protein
MAEIPPPPVQNVDGYRKTLMRNYITATTIQPLREVLLLPPRVSECKTILLSHIEKSPEFKDPNPEQVMKNIRASAILFYRMGGKHLDLRIDVPRELQLISTSENGDFASGSDEDDEAALKREEQELAKRQKRLEDRKKKLAGKKDK